MKILYVTTIGITMIFFKELIKSLIDEGHTVDIICNETEDKVPQCYHDWKCKVYHHSCARSPLSTGNLHAVKQIKKVVLENGYDVVHCHTPVAAICTRLACKSFRKNGLKVLYTAHGFHFYKGAPFKNWIMYYPVEKYCAKHTDTIITINKEDYDFALKNMKTCDVEYVPGVGIDVDRFRNTTIEKSTKRAQLGIPENAFLLSSVGELNKNKNHKVIIDALAKTCDNDVHYAIVGSGVLDEYLRKYAQELGVSDRVHMLGYREDIAEIYKASDVCCFPSIREGLGLAAVEGMACGLPVIAADNRGTREYMIDHKNGFVCNSRDACAFADAIKALKGNRELIAEIKVNNEKKAENFSYKIVNSSLREIYGV